MMKCNLNEHKKHAFLRCTLLIVLLSLLPVMNVGAEENVHADLSVKMPEKVEKVTPFTVTVTVKADLPIAMAQFEVAYDETHLQLVNVATGTFLTGGPTINDETPGHIYFVWESLTPVESAGDWLVCTFTSDTDGIPSVDVEKNDDLIFGSPELEIMDVSVNHVPITSTDGDEKDTTDPEGTNNGINLAENKEIIAAGDKATLSVENDSSENLLWETSNAAVATVSDGVVEAHRTGTAVITVMNEDGTKNATCIVTVKENKQEQSVESAPVEDDQIKQKENSPTGGSSNTALYGAMLGSLALFILAYVLLHKKK